MLFKLLLATTILLFLPSAHAQDIHVKKAATPIDLIELLDELGDEEADGLDAAMSDVESKRNPVNQTQTKQDNPKNTTVEHSNTGAER